MWQANLRYSFTSFCDICDSFLKRMLVFCSVLWNGKTKNDALWSLQLEWHKKVWNGETCYVDVRTESNRWVFRCCSDPICYLTWQALSRPLRAFIQKMAPECSSPNRLQLLVFRMCRGCLSSMARPPRVGRKTWIGRRFLLLFWSCTNTIWLLAYHSFSCVPLVIKGLGKAPGKGKGCGLRRWVGKGMV